VLLPFFSLLLARRVVADPKCRSHTIDLADAHTQIKTLSQDNLKR
jgi:hypothetical protein